MKPSPWQTVSLILALIAVLALPGCGFRPLYGEQASGVSSADELRRVRLNTRNDRLDYLVRTNLINDFQTQYATEAPAYELKVRLRERREGVAVERDASITRFNYELRANLELMDLATNEVIFTGRSRSVAAYNVVDSQFATLSAQRDAEERAAQDVSADIKLQIAIFLDRRYHSGSETAPASP